MRPFLPLMVLAALLTSCSAGPPGESRYLAEISSARAAKDAALAGVDSPVPAAQRDRFLPLAYYPPDPAYSVPAAFEPDPPGQRPRMELQTSANKRRSMERLGVLRFTLQGRQLQLAAFVEAGQPPDRLFVPFTDATTGSETYAAGRYLEILPETTGIYAVDFNRAYNPYCYYNPAYDCPFPPKENLLSVPIPAGEKVKPAQ